jgi:hypothetical protein
MTAILLLLVYGWFKREEGRSSLLTVAGLVVVGGGSFLTGSLLLFKDISTPYPSAELPFAFSPD